MPEAKGPDPGPDDFNWPGRRSDAPRWKSGRVPLHWQATSVEDFASRLRHLTPKQRRAAIHDFNSAGRDITPAQKDEFQGLLKKAQYQVEPGESSTIQYSEWSDEDIINACPKKLTHDELLDLVAVAKERRSNALMNLAKSRSSAAAAKVVVKSLLTGDETDWSYGDPPVFDRTGF